MATMLGAPSVTQEDFAIFHASHFSTTSVDHFAENYLGPVGDEDYSGEFEDDGLGYYADGVKRTLTDEQIAIFRHSEIEASLRAQRIAAEAKEDDIDASDAKEDGDGSPIEIPAKSETLDRAGSTAVEAVQCPADAAELEDGELDEEPSNPQVSTPTLSQEPNRNKKNKGKSKNGKRGQRPPQAKSYYKQHVKPDLRKRTWDVVEVGLGNLDYDEDPDAGAAPIHAAQRRRISYDD